MMVGGTASQDENLTQLSYTSFLPPRCQDSVEILFWFFSFYRDIAEIITACQNGQARESAVKCFPKDTTE